MPRDWHHATTVGVSAPEPVITGAKAAQDAAQAWQDVRNDPGIEFGPIDVDLPPPSPLPESGGAGSGAPVNPPEPSQANEWLRSIFEPIGKALGIAWPVMQWILIGLAVLIVLYGLWRLIQPWLERREAARAEAAAEAADWVPDRDAAAALLDDADALAAEGRFAEATHLLLMRSVDHIAAARPEWVMPASTTREISAISGLSDHARTAFGSIANRVERSLFALRSLDRDDWLAARAAYADFALVPVATEIRA